MVKRFAFLAVGCWCLVAAHANAQYSPGSTGQPFNNVSVLSGDDYYSNYNAYQRQIAAQRQASNPYAQVPVAAVPVAGSGYAAAGIPVRPAGLVTQNSLELPSPPVNSGTTPMDTSPSDGAPATLNPTPDSSGAAYAPTTGGGVGPIADPNYSGQAGGGCATGNCCTPCKTCCCAGRMGPGPLFYGMGMTGGPLGGFGAGGMGAGWLGGTGLGMGGIGMGGMGGVGMGGVGAGAYGAGGYGAGAGAIGSGGSCGVGGACGGSGYGMGMSPFGAAIAGTGMTGFANGFYAQVGALFLHRDTPNKVWTTFDETNQANQLMNTQQAKPGTGFGGQITIGHCLGCNYAVEFTYWGLSTMTGSSTIVDPNNNLGTVLDESYITFNKPGGPAASYYFEGAHQQTIWRRSNIQNVELNFLAYPLINPNTRFRASLLGGVRYFYFSDQVIFGTAAFNHGFDDDGGADAAYLNVKTRNNLVGVQIGSRLSYFLTPRVSVFAVPKFGLYNNYMTENASLYTGDGYYAYNVASRRNAFATLAEIDLGAQYFITPRLSVFGAYRLVNVSGVALADDQIPHYLNDTAAMVNMNHNGDLILQGGYVGFTWNF